MYVNICALHIIFVGEFEALGADRCLHSFASDTDGRVYISSSPHSVAAAAVTAPSTGIN
jgi:hypothetical protein